MLISNFNARKLLLELLGDELGISQDAYTPLHEVFGYEDELKDIFEAVTFTSGRVYLSEDATEELR